MRLRAVGSTVSVWVFAGVLTGALSGCGPSYSPDTYATNAVQQANKVDRGEVVGVRQVDVSASGTTGAVSGAAAGGIAGAQAGAGPISALAALGGSLVGGVAGVAAEHTVDDTTAFEYIVRKVNGDLVSVTQKDKTPLAVGQKVLVIAGNQARIVPDYTVAADPPPAAKPAAPVKAEPLPATAAPAQPAADGAAPAAADAGPKANGGGNSGQIAAAPSRPSSDGGQSPPQMPQAEAGPQNSK